MRSNGFGLVRLDKRASPWQQCPAQKHLKIGNLNTTSPSSCALARTISRERDGTVQTIVIIFLRTLRPVLLVVPFFVASTNLDSLHIRGYNNRFSKGQGRANAD